MPGAARRDGTALYEPQWGPVRGLGVCDSVYKWILGVLCTAFGGVLKMILSLMTFLLVSARLCGCLNNYARAAAMIFIFIVD